MQAKMLILLGTAVALAVGALGILWVPYGDTGTPDASNSHFFALGVTLLDVLAVFFYAAFRSSPASRQPAYSGIVAGYFLGINSLVTVALLARTYFGLSYAIFWGAQVLQWAVVLVAWFAGHTIGQSAGNRDAQAKIASIRKESLINELENLRRRFPAGEDAVRRSLLSQVTRLVEELRYFPNQEIAVTAGNPFGRVIQWRIAAEAFLGASPASSTAATPHELFVEAGAIASALAGYKR